MINPLIIAAVTVKPGWGHILISRCPGRTDFDQDLDYDLDSISRAGAAAVLTLTDQEELDELGVSTMGAAVRDRGMDWFHMPISDYQTPDGDWEARWPDVRATLHRYLREGRSVHMHCRGGCGRAGMTAARLLTEIGFEAEQAIQMVRSARPCAIETPEQEAAVRAARPAA